MSASSELPKGLRLGSTLTFLGGLFVFSVGTWFFVQFLIGQAHPAEPWPAGQFTPAPYSLDDIAACNPTLADDFVLAQHIQFVNVMNTGFVIMLLSIFGLRRYLRWSWYSILATALWVGLNDALALFQGHQPLVPLIPAAIVLVGLILTHGPVFSDGSGARGA
jgi:hypothetical protein